MKIGIRKPKSSLKIDHSYLKDNKDYGYLHKVIKWTVAASMVIITFIAISKALSDDGTRVEAGLNRIDEYINMPNFKTEDSIKAFSESFTEIYLSSEISDKDKKELLQQYSEISYSELKAKFKDNVSSEVVNVSCSDIQELSNDLINVTVLATIKFSELVSTKSDVAEEVIENKIINYKIKLPILKKQTDGEFLYALIKSPSFEKVTAIDESYEPQMIKLTRVDQSTSKEIEETVKSFLKVFYEGTSQEIIYFYKGENPPEGFLGGFKIQDFKSIEVYEVEGGEEYVAYASIISNDEFETEYTNSYEMILTRDTGKYFITDFGVKTLTITDIEN